MVRWLCFIAIVMDLQLRTQSHAFLLQAMKFEFFMFTGGFLELIQLPFLSIGFGLAVWTYFYWQQWHL